MIREPIFKKNWNFRTRYRWQFLSRCVQVRRCKDLMLFQIYRLGEKVEKGAHAQRQIATLA